MILALEDRLPLITLYMHKSVFNIHKFFPMWFLLILKTLHLVGLNFKPKLVFMKQLCNRRWQYNPREKAIISSNVFSCEYTIIYLGITWSLSLCLFSQGLFSRAYFSRLFLLLDQQFSYYLLLLHVCITNA